MNSALLPFAKDAKPELAKPGKRKPLNRVQIITLCARQNLLCGCGCGAPLDPVCIDEHIVPRETLPADRCDDLENRALFNVPCAKTKTVGDQAIIGHWRRARGESGQRARREKNGPSLKSRNTFDKQRPLPIELNTKRSPDGAAFYSGRKGESALSKFSRGYVKRKIQNRKGWK